VGFLRGSNGHEVPSRCASYWPFDDGMIYQMKLQKNLLNLITLVLYKSLQFRKKYIGPASSKAHLKGASISNKMSQFGGLAPFIAYSDWSIERLRFFLISI